MYERILTEMKLKGIRYVADLERKAGLSQGTIRNIRYGHLPTSTNINKIANALGISVNYLMTGEPDDDPFDDPTPPELYQKQRKVLALLEGLSDESYQAAIDYLMYLKFKEEGNDERTDY